MASINQNIINKVEKSAQKYAQILIQELDLKGGFKSTEKLLYIERSKSIDILSKFNSKSEYFKMIAHSSIEHANKISIEYNNRSNVKLSIDSTAIEKLSTEKGVSKEEFEKASKKLSSKVAEQNLWKGLIKSFPNSMQAFLAPLIREIGGRDKSNSFTEYFNKVKPSQLISIMVKLDKSHPF